MKEPRRWLDLGDSRAESRLIRAVMNEPFPNAAMHRAGRRLGISSGLLSITSANLATAAAPQALAVGASNGVALTVILVKAIAVGLGLGSLLVGTAYWTTHVRPATSAPPSNMVAIVGTQTASEPAVSELTSPQPREENGPGIDAAAEPSAGADGRDLHRFGAKSVPRPMLVPSRGLAENDATTSSAETLAAVVRFANESEPPSAPPVGVATSNEKEIAPPKVRQGSVLAREVRALDAVRDALRLGDARRALDELDRCEQERIFQMLSREAAVLRVEALGGLGRTQQAAILARRLLNAGVSPAQRTSLERWVAAGQR